MVFSPADDSYRNCRLNDFSHIIPSVSGRVCLPFHETFSSLSSLQCTSVGCGEAGGGGGVNGLGGCSCEGRSSGGGKGGGRGGRVITREAESMEIDKDVGGEGEARPPSPPSNSISQCRR